jgi:nicotinamidase-related amidase
LPVLSLLQQGYEVYVLTDVAGDVDESSHQMAIQRMVQAGAVPVTWLAVMLEWQGDWANSATAAQVGEMRRVGTWDCVCERDESRCEAADRQLALSFPEISSAACRMAATVSLIDSAFGVSM